MQNRLDCPLAPVLAERLRGARDQLTQQWLERIVARVSIEANRIFPTQDLLDHVPLLIDGIADYMEDPADEISADMPVIAKAMELGQMRQEQGFSAHEILKEYEIMGGVLFTFLVRIVDSVEEECTRAELLSCAHRLFRAVAVIQQVTTNQYLRISDDEVHEREERLRSFNRMLTHELKNRIAAVNGAAGMLREDWVDSDAAQRARFLSIVERNTEGMQETLEQLLELSRTDESTRRQRHVHLPEVAAEVARQLREMAREQDVQIRIAPDLPSIEVDAAAVELCLVNYVSNGIKYADPAKPERWVEVSASRRDLPGGDGEVIIRVRDNGIGVPPEARARVFDRFYRSDPGSDIEGTGLGLSLVRDTVQALGGRAWADFDDGDGRGSTFSIALPARRDEDTRPDGDSPPEPPANP